MQNKLYFKTPNGYRVADYIHMICIDCADKKNGVLRPKSYPFKTMCDMCEENKPDIYTISSFDWSEYDPEG
jgi:hypothetical protein